MNVQKQMQIVNEIAGDICENLGALVGQGVISFEDGAEIIRTINDKHIKWMESKFSPSEIYNFVYHS